MVIPDIIGALGTVLKGFEESLEEIKMIQKTAMLRDQSEY